MSSQQEEFITATEASRRIPSAQGGKKTHVSTVIRWIRSGVIEGYRRGRHYFVRASSLAELMIPVTPEQARTRDRRMSEAARKRREQEVHEKAKKYGLL